MILRGFICIITCILGMSSVQAQTNKQDTLFQIKKEGEIYINPEAIKNIEFNFLPQTEKIKGKPMMDEHKKWMGFRKDLPASLTDTTIMRKKKYIRMLPYSIWEYDNSHFNHQSKNDTLTIRMKLNMDKIKPLPGMGHGYQVLPAGMDQSVAPSNHPIGGFSADKLLFENLTKRGRAIKRNRKRAKAWKIYNDYVPTKEDSLKWYGNKNRAPKDTTNHFINTK